MSDTDSSVDDVEEERREELLMMLQSMGFPIEYAAKAVTRVDPMQENATELCLHWMEENPMEEEEEKEIQEALIEPLVSMGFSPADAERALANNDNDQQRAVVWLLSEKTKQIIQNTSDDIKSDEGFSKGRGGGAAGGGGRQRDGYIDEIKEEDGDGDGGDDDDDDDDDDNDRAHDQLIEVRELTTQIVDLQELVLTYQNKYLALKRRLAKVQRELDRTKQEMALQAEIAADQQQKQQQGSSGGAGGGGGGGVGNVDNMTIIPPPPPREEARSGRSGSRAAAVDDGDEDLSPPPPPDQGRSSKSKVRRSPSRGNDNRSGSSAAANAGLRRQRSQQKFNTGKKLGMENRPKLGADRGQAGGNRRMINMIQEATIKPVERGKGWKNSAGYASMHVSIKQLIEIRAKVSKTFFVVARVDSLALKSKEVVSAKSDDFSVDFHFAVSHHTENVQITLFDGDGSKGYVGRAVLSMESLSKPSDRGWHSLKVMRASSFPDRVGVDVPVEVKLHIEFSTKPFDPSLNHGLSSLRDEKSDASVIGNAIRNKVSKNLRRYQQDGFDLDLTYITHQLIAMGYPSTKLAGVYRNRMKDVQAFFDSKHKGRYKIYNLSFEEYSPSKFRGAVAHFPFEERGPCVFPQIPVFCNDVAEWLDQHAQNVIAVHCQDKGDRTAFLMCCYMLHSKQAKNADDVVRQFVKARTTDNKIAAVPSQLRYIRYYDRFINGDASAMAKSKGAVLSPLEQVRSKRPKRLMLTTARIYGIPPTVRPDNVQIWFRVTRPGDATFKFSSRKVVKPRRFKDADCIVFGIPEESHVLVGGDMMVEFFYGSTFRKTKMFHFWFNTRFVPIDRRDKSKYHIVLKKSQLDRAWKDTKHKLYPKGMRIELMFVDAPVKRRR
eukprot:TRINITY_DN67895_c12_g1_i1.p1 TRINITY_DN67895_c12_g1~~TRINITY_DN67895_c12_g1_i1.p1  ORF type:complete len:887 (-),score=522.47 TRINITY_DN67895_c12_g1_i1:80-2740(-)